MQKELQVRKKIRMEGYDYSGNGAYFITICTQKRLHLFGEIEDGVGQGLCSCRLTEIGEVIKKEWQSLAQKYPHIIFDNFVVMPNHIHAIIIINFNECHERNKRQGQDKWGERQEQSPCPTPTKPRHMMYPRTTIGDIICAYKSITTKICNKNDNITGRKIWQFRFHDRIIRNETEYRKIWKYINENPLKWREDIFANE